MNVIEVSHIQAILIINLITIIVHQLEEYALPRSFLKNNSHNKKINITKDEIIVYPFLLSSIIFPNVIWLGLSTILFTAVYGIIGHVVAYPIRIKKLYNPGIASTVFLSIPISVYYIWYISTNGLVTTSDYIWGAFTFHAFLSVVFSIIALPAFCGIRTVCMKQIQN